MTTYMEVEPSQIRRLSDIQLTTLLKCLLLAEAEKYGIARSAVDVNLSITVPDGGEDGRIEWEGEPTHTDYVPAQVVSFQVKATNVNTATIKKELLRRKKGSSTLKRVISETFDRGGAYIIFNSRPCTASKRQSLILEARRVLAEMRRNDANAVKIDVYGQNRIADWCNCYPGIVLWVHGETGQGVPPGLQTWYDLGKIRLFRNTYFSNDALNKITSRLYETIRHPQKHLRLIGLAGLGKTRLLLEVFRTSLDHNKDELDALRNALIYLNASERHNTALESVRHIVNSKRRAVVVVDDCDCQLATQLRMEVTKVDSNVSLVSIGHPDEGYSGQGETVVLEPNQLHDVVRSMLAQAYPSLRDGDIERIGTLADGFPQMACLLAEAQLGDNEELGPVTDKMLVDRILWGTKTPDEEERRALGALAMLSYVGFRDDVRSEREVVGTLMADGGDAFYRIVRKHIRRGTVQEYGRMVRIRPEPLAFALCESWLRDTTPERIMRIMSGCEEHGLLDRIFARLRKLHYLEEARTLVRHLCRADAQNGPIGKIESEKGLDRLRLLSEVEPEAVMEVMERIFGQWHEQDWRDKARLRVPASRVIQNLCWWETTFARAGTFFLRLAAAAYADSGSDTQSDFITLFRYVLPGTQAHPALRWILLQQALRSDSHNERTLGILGLLSAVDLGPAMRIGGVECQGCRKNQRDWQVGSTEDRREFIQYWKDSCEYLISVACEDSPSSMLVREKLGQMLSNFLRPVVGAIPLSETLQMLQHMVSTIGRRFEGYWPQARSSLYSFLDLEDRVPAALRRQVEDLIGILTPIRLQDRIESILINPARRFSPRLRQSSTDEAITQAENLASELAASPNSLRAYFEAFRKANISVAGSFGTRLGRALEDPTEFAISYVDFLDSEGASELAGVLVGCLTVMDEGPKGVVIDRISKSRLLRLHLPWLLVHLSSSTGRLDVLLDQVEKGSLPVQSFAGLEFSPEFHAMDVNVVSGIVRCLANVGVDGAALSLQLLSRYCSHPPLRWKLLASELREIMTCSGLFATVSSHGFHEVHDFVEALPKVISGGAEDQAMAAEIVADVLVVAKRESMSYGIAPYAVSALTLLLDRYPEQTWNIVGEAILSCKEDEVFNFSRVLLPLFDDEHEQGISFISLVPESVLFPWCREHVPLGPIRLAGMTPAFDMVSETAQWTPVAKHLIDNYGQESLVLRALDMRIGCFSWSGSEIPGRTLRRGLYSTLVDHNLYEVRVWARAHCDAYDRNIDRIREREAEYHVRYLD